MKIEEHETYEGQYWVVWDDGVRSEDFYNKSRAKEHLKMVSEILTEDLNYDAPEKPREAHWCVFRDTPLPYYLTQFKSLYGQFSRDVKT